MSGIAGGNGYNDEMATLKEAVQALKRGKAIVCPTDTVYGLVADATSRKAIERVFQIKGREKGKPLPVFVKNIAMAKHIAHISKEQEQFLKKVWPGKVTVVLETKHVLPKEVELGGKIALRIPDHETVIKLLEKTNRPLTGTSANVSGQPPCSSAEEIMAQFHRRKRKPDLIVDVGRLRKSKPSKVVDVTGEKHKVLRK